MPLVDLEFKGKQKGHHPLHVRIKPRTPAGEIEIECSQDGMLFYLQLSEADWADVIAGIQANMKDRA